MVLNVEKKPQSAREKTCLSFCCSWATLGIKGLNCEPWKMSLAGSFWERATNVRLREEKGSCGKESRFFQPIGDQISSKAVLTVACRECFPETQCTQREQIDSLDHCQMPQALSTNVWQLLECDQRELAFSTCGATVIPFQVAGRPIVSLFECVENVCMEIRKRGISCSEVATLVCCTELRQQSTLQLFLLATAYAKF